MVLTMKETSALPLAASTSREHEMDFEFVSPERRALMFQIHEPTHDPLTDINAWLLEDGETREDGACQAGTNRVGAQALMEAAPDVDIDLNISKPRHIREHRSRRAHRQSYAVQSPRYHDWDKDCSRANAYERQLRAPSPDSLKHRAQAIVVAAMADLDVREERDDRRGGDNYRGGGKRRRDGKLAAKGSIAEVATNMYAR